jgi:hypothetical protein
MLKIESNRNLTAPKTSAVSGNSVGTAEGFDGGAAGAENGGDFATVLQNLTSKKNQTAEKDLTPEVKEKAKAKPEEKAIDSKENSAKEKLDNSNSATQNEEAAGAAHAQKVGAEITVEAETSLPPARSILHIADMERIIASVRTHNFDGSNQVLITLKNSVFDGLQIKLTANENQRITAELIASNEKVKAQLDARGGELADLLRQRGVKLDSLKTSVGAETANGDGSRRNSENLEAITGEKLTTTFAEAETVQVEESETENTYRV